jgi:transposase
LEVKDRHSYYFTEVRDLPISGKKVCLHVKKYRYKCNHCNGIRSEKIEWLEPYSRMTKRFRDDLGRLTAIANNSDVAWYTDLDDETVYRQDKKLLEERAKKN